MTPADVVTLAQIAMTIGFTVLGLLALYLEIDP